MSLRLISIQFYGVTEDGPALPLATLKESWQACCSANRRPTNETVDVCIPEWQAVSADSVQSSPVAVCAAQVTPVNQVIRVVLESSEIPDTFEIRALDGSGGWNVLGIPQAREIKFERCSRLSLELRLGGARFTQVASHEDVWLWQWRRPGGYWDDLARTQHRVFVTLAPPTSPWGTACDGVHPWVEVLEVATNWALGARDVNDAASRITRAVFALGQAAGSHPQFTYVGPSFTEYFPPPIGVPNFDCAAFLGALGGCPSLPTVFDCSDTAAIVSTFANILGSRLFQTRTKGAGFSTRPICLIGQTEFLPAQFGNHEVAFAEPITVEGRVWDACLLISRGPNPDLAPHSGINSVGFEYGRFEDHAYFWRLASPESAGSVSIKGQVVPDGNRGLGPLHKVLCPPDGLNPPPPDDSPTWFYWNLEMVPRIHASWSALRITVTNSAAGLFALDSMWLAGSLKVQVQIDVNATAAHARSRMACRRASFGAALIRMAAGDGGFANAAHTDILFTRGNLFIEVRIAGPLEHSLKKAAQAFDDLFTSQTASPPTGIVPPRTGVEISDLLPTTGAAANLWYRVYSPRGRVHAEKGFPVYDGYQPGPQDLIVFTHDPAGHIGRTVHTIDIQ